MFKQKKILVFLMLFIVAMPVLFSITSIVKERMIKNKMRARLETSLLKTITLNEADVQWVEENEEVSINGNLFDVKTYHIADGKITLTGLFDIDEIKLKNQLENLMHQKERSDTPLNQLVVKLLFSPLYINSAYSNYENTGQIIQQKFIAYPQKKVSKNYLDKLVPPPKFA
jgi:hypothetical protein